MARFARELEGVREEVLQYLLQTLGIADERPWECRIEIDVERESLGFRNVVEHPMDGVPERREHELFGFHRDRARLDLREVEDVVDQRQ